MLLHCDEAHEIFRAGDGDILLRLGGVIVHIDGAADSDGRDVARDRVDASGSEGCGCGERDCCAGKYDAFHKYIIYNVMYQW